MLYLVLHSEEKWDIPVKIFAKEFEGLICDSKGAYVEFVWVRNIRASSETWIGG